MSKHEEVTIRLEAQVGEFNRAMQEATQAMDALWLAILDGMPWLDKLLLFLEHPTWYFKARRLRRARRK